MAIRRKQGQAALTRRQQRRAARRRGPSLRQQRRRAHNRDHDHSRHAAFDRGFRGIMDLASRDRLGEIGYERMGDVKPKRKGAGKKQAKRRLQKAEGRR